MIYIYSAQMSLFGQRDVVGFGGDDFCVKLIDRDTANALIMRHHYSRKFYNATYIHLALFIEGEVMGVLQFGYAMNPASASSVVAGTEMDEYLELNRMWLDDAAPRNSESRALAMAVKFIRRAYPKVKWIQSFADERCGLFGTVYQAAGFTFHGEHMGRFWELDGVVYHDSILTDSRKELTPAGSRLRANKDRAVRLDLRQFRYLRFLQPRFAKQCRFPALPFPKPDYAARLVDDPVPAGASEAQILGAAPITSVN